MTPYLKAHQLINDYKQCLIFYPKSRFCALITVNEILKHCSFSERFYWQQVKAYLENL